MLDLDDAVSDVEKKNKLGWDLKTIKVGTCNIGIGSDERSNVVCNASLMLIKKSPILIFSGSVLEAIVSELL